jgi:hypothetical protein
MLLDRGFANARQILNDFFGWFARQVNWNCQQCDANYEAQADSF